MQFVIVECSQCQKKIIKLVENENEDVMEFCPRHTKYICKKCVQVLGRCTGCWTAFCKDCTVHKPDAFAKLCEECYMRHIAFERKDS